MSHHCRTWVQKGKKLSLMTLEEKPKENEKPAKPFPEENDVIHVVRTKMVEVFQIQGGERKKIGEYQNTCAYHHQGKLNKSHKLS